MLGSLLALFAAVTFALNNAAYRRGALTGSVAQGMAVSLSLGVLIFFAASILIGGLEAIFSFSSFSFWLFCAAGLLHFAWGRYCNYRATKAMGANLVGPPQQLGIIVSLVLAIIVLGETLTPLRILGILLVVLGPAISLRARMATQGPDAPKPTFQPNYVEGYYFAFLSALGFGVSPIFVKVALDGGGLVESIAGGFIAYLAATAIMALALLKPGLAAHIAAVKPVSGKWFSTAAVLVSLSQMTSYMALALAPVSVVMPIQRLSLVFRVLANSMLNREHEVIGGRIWVATGLGLLGAIFLSLSTEFVLNHLTLPDWLEQAAQWHWP
ncbi:MULTISPECIES: DMT family transporter [Chelativorans]|jgi:drug/metabolite transporter (DMT)-like permease|uniref:EamA domain-containing protein n=1 Tax=Chelativorans sp. (strain BNC1) TaxID=266779 RepID=Q11JH3_CHESB|nr:MULTISPECIES: EamA family transporter [Chelativorans]